MKTIIANGASLEIYQDDALLGTVPYGMFSTVPSSTGVSIQVIGKSVNFDIEVNSVLDGVELTSISDIAKKLSSFKRGGGSGTGATEWGQITGNIDDQTDLIDYISDLLSKGSTEAFSVTAVGGVNEIITHDTGDETVQAATLVASNSAARLSAIEEYTVTDGVIEIRTAITDAGAELIYTYTIN